MVVFLTDCHCKQIKKMKRVSAWALIILMGSILSYTVWNCFATPNFLMGKTNVVSGKIIEVFPSREVKSYNRRIKYVYTVNGKDYFDFKNLGTNERIQLNDVLANVEDVPEFVAHEREARDEADRPFITTSLKVDGNTKMGVVSDIKQELRKAGAFKINYSTKKKVIADNR